MLRRRVVLIDPYSSGHHVSYAQILAKGLRDKGKEVVVIGDSNLLEELGNLIVDGIPLGLQRESNVIIREWRKFHYIRFAVKLAQKMKPEIIHFLYLDYFVRALVREGVYGDRYRATLHKGYMLPEFVSRPLNRLKASLDISALRCISRTGFRVMVHSRWLQKSLSKIIGHHTFDFVPYPIEPFDFDLNKSRLKARLFREKLGLSKDSKLVLVFGGTRYDKGADLAIKALRHLDANWHLLIAGKPEKFNENILRELALRYGVSKRVHLYLQYIPKECVPDIFLASDIVLLPYRSIFSGQSGPLTIAASFGIPIAAANVPVLAETVEQYRLGILFPPEDVYGIAQALQVLEEKPIRSHQLEFSQDHSPAAFIEAVLRSYVGSIDT